MNQKISFAAIAVIMAVSLTSCSVEYKARHPRHPRHKKVIVVGMVKPAIPADSIGMELTHQNPLNKTYGINQSKL